MLCVKSKSAWRNAYAKAKNTGPAGPCRSLAGLSRWPENPQAPGAARGWRRPFSRGVDCLHHGGGWGWSGPRRGPKPSTKSSGADTAGADCFQPHRVFGREVFPAVRRKLRCTSEAAGCRGTAECSGTSQPGGCPAFLAVALWKNGVLALSGRPERRRRSAGYLFGVERECYARSSPPGL